MRICFIDTVTSDYRADTPLSAPLGGTQAAACFLAQELAARGHHVALWNKTSRPGMAAGVECINFHVPQSGLRTDYDVVVLMSSVNSYSIEWLSAIFPSTARFVLWIQHAHDQMGSQGLADRRVADFFHAVALVSGWQARCYVAAFQLAGEKVHVMRNAANPAFGELFADGEAVLPHKGGRALAAYASAPHRGLRLAAEAFVRLRKLKPDAEFAVFCGPNAEDVERIDADPLLGALRRTPGVTHVGSVSQPELARRLKSAALLFYPNTFPETSCVSVIEAMAAGCRVLTSNLGALPETSAPFGVLRPPFEGLNRDVYLDDFAAAAAVEIDFLRNDPSAEFMLRAQVDQSRVNRWRVRAVQWEALFIRLLERPGR
jgi:glycosyltransferase involved in cell wall biosynthesis